MSGIEKIVGFYRGNKSFIDFNKQVSLAEVAGFFGGIKGAGLAEEIINTPLSVSIGSVLGDAILYYAAAGITRYFDRKEHYKKNTGHYKKEMTTFAAGSLVIGSISSVISGGLTWYLNKEGYTSEAAAALARIPSILFYISSINYFAIKTKLIETKNEVIS